MAISDYRIKTVLKSHTGHPYPCRAPMPTHDYGHFHFTSQNFLYISNSCKKNKAPYPHTHNSLLPAHHIFSRKFFTSAIIRSFVCSWVQAKVNKQNLMVSTYPELDYYCLHLSALMQQTVSKQHIHMQIKLCVPEKQQPQRRKLHARFHPSACLTIWPCYSRNAEFCSVRLCGAPMAVCLDPCSGSMSEHWGMY